MFHLHTLLCPSLLVESQRQQGRSTQLGDTGQSIAKMNPASIICYMSKLVIDHPKKSVCFHSYTMLWQPHLPALRHPRLFPFFGFEIAVHAWLTLGTPKRLNPKSDACVHAWATQVPPPWIKLGWIQPMVVRSHFNRQRTHNRLFGSSWLKLYTVKQLTE